ncbi:hypothetical protein BKA56DRAFT_31284 [Ilyonectria sp. MPI-CAGE-AT-0026]|nr:hypothetical protein BKA56DRAFT_31284 [Ilyonectria sp. MPI-CAGE-AT-0026]
MGASGASCSLPFVVTMQGGRAEKYCGRPSQYRTNHHAESCPVVSSPLPIINGERAHPKNRQGPLKPSAPISRPRQIRVARDLHAAPAPGTGPDAPVATEHTFSLGQRHFAGSLRLFPVLRSSTRRSPTCVQQPSNRASPTRIHDVSPTT